MSTAKQYELFPVSTVIYFRYFNNLELQHTPVQSQLLEIFLAWDRLSVSFMSFLRSPTHTPHTQNTQRPCPRLELSTVCFGWLSNTMAALQVLFRKQFILISNNTIYVEQPDLPEVWSLLVFPSQPQQIVEHSQMMAWGRLQFT